MDVAFEVNGHPFGLVGVSNEPLVINDLWEITTFKGIIWQRYDTLNKGVQEIGWVRVSWIVCLVFVTIAKVLIKTKMLAGLSIMEWELLQGKGM